MVPSRIRHHRRHNNNDSSKRRSKRNGPNRTTTTTRAGAIPKLPGFDNNNNNNNISISTTTTTHSISIRLQQSLLLFTTHARLVLVQRLAEQLQQARVWCGRDGVSLSPLAHEPAFFLPMGLCRKLLRPVADGVGQRPGLEHDVARIHGRVGPVRVSHGGRHWIEQFELGHAIAHVLHHDQILHAHFCPDVGLFVWHYPHYVGIGGRHCAHYVG
mmetsp:Transcript_14933/g.33921  ORF Transcript_14933/g.33921 Transcript_14933/m.33921 type:complete len:214 (-) Transcript_14933:1106-1747(-)